MTTLAFVGCAHIHTPGFVKMIKERPAGDVTVRYCWDPTPERAARWAGELGARVTGDLAEIWKDKDVTAVVICSETNRHLDLVKAAVKAKKHLFVEKPLGAGAKDAQLMAAAIEKAGLIFQTGYFMRGSAVHQFLKGQIEAGNLGKITRARGSNCHSGALGGWFDAKPNDVPTDWRWMADPALSGVGAFGDLGTHSLDILIWLLGEVESVTAQVDNGTARYEGCDETGEGLLRFKSGVIGTLAAAWDDVANPVSLLVSGTEGHAAVINGELFYTSKRVDGADGKQAWTKLPEPWPHAFQLFLDAVGGKSDVPLVTPREAAYRSAVMEALYEGAARAKWVKPRGQQAPATAAAAAETQPEAGQK